MGCEKNRSKSWRLKKALAASLAVITVFSVLPAARPAAAGTAGPYVGLRTVFKTLKAGQTNCMTLKNNKLKWEITKVSTNDRTIAMVYGKTKASFMIKGKAEGRTTVKAKLKTAARKKYNTKTVSCRVNVIKQENLSEAVVSDQAGLEKALQGSGLKKLVIHTDQPGRLVIPKGTYADTELTVQAPAADIENNGIFKSITIQAVKPDTWFENAAGNVMRVMADAARIVVNEGASLKKLNFACTGAKVRLEVNGTIDELTISAKLELSVSGSTKTPIPAVIEEGAKDTVIETSAPLKVTAHASASITFQKGAEGSTVEVKSKDADVDVKNNTTTEITILKADGTVERKAPVRVTLSSPPYGSVSNTPPLISRPVTPDAIVTTGGSVEAGPGESIGGEGSGAAGPGGSWVPVYPTVDDFMKVMNPKLSIVITRCALEADTVTVSASAILILDIKPDAVQPEDGYIKWRCPDVEGIEGIEGAEGEKGLEDWMKLEGSEPKKILIPMPEINLEELTGDQTIRFEMGFGYEQGEFSEEMCMFIYDASALKTVGSEMAAAGENTRTLEIPFETGSLAGYGYIMVYPDDLSLYIKNRQ